MTDTVENNASALAARCQILEDELRRCRANLNALFENTNDLIVAWAEDGHLTAANSAYRAFVEHTFQLEVREGMLMAELVSGALFAATMEDFERALSGQQFCKTFSLASDAGSQVFEVTFNPIVVGDTAIGVLQSAHNVTARKRAEKALLESEERFRNLFEHYPDAVFVEDFSGYVLDVNPAACRLHGLERDALVGKHILHLVPPDWQDEVLKTFPQLVSGERALIESFSRTQEGEVVPVEIGVNHIDYSGQPALLLLVRDITERKNAERVQLRRNRELAMLNRASQALTSTLDQDQILAIVLEEVRRLLNVFASSIWLLDDETGELVCQQATGPQAELVLGWRLKPGQGIAGWVVQFGKSVLVSDTQEDGRHFWGVANRIQRDLRSILSVPLHARRKVIGVLQVVDESVARFTKADQTLLEPLAAAAAIAIENARLVEGLEAEVAARTAEIVAERDKSEAILRSAGDGIAMTDPALRVHYVNPAFEKLTGYRAERIVDLGLDYLLSDEVSEHARHAIRVAYESGVAWRGEVSIRRRNGRMCAVIMSISPIRDADGQLQGYVTSLQDISPLKELEQARQKFITNVSHQLRTPVTTLKAQAYMMQYLQPSDTLQHYVDMMGEQIALLMRLIEDIIEMTVLDSGEAVRTWDRILVADLLTSMVTSFERVVETAGLDFVLATSLSEDCFVRGDVARLMEACHKILDNAVKFTPAGGCVTVAADLVEDEGQTWLALSIRDTGPGIPPDEQHKVFDRFFQGRLAESGHIPGTGLGLSFAQAIVQAHGGKITVASQVGEGSTFTVWLPLVAPDEPGETKEPSRVGAKLRVP